MAESDVICDPDGSISFTHCALAIGQLFVPFTITFWSLRFAKTNLPVSRFERGFLCQPAAHTERY